MRGFRILGRVRTGLAPAIDRALWPKILRGCRLQRTVSNSVESEFV
jgi:hypothetical protein